MTKSPQTSAPRAQMPPGHPDPSAGMMPVLSWKLPTGWEEVPAGQMRVASFRIKGADNKMADVSVVPLPGQAGSDLDNVNRWRTQQLGLAAVSEAELIKLTEEVPVGSATGKLYDLAGTNPGSGEPSRILAAILRREGMAWFFKVSGDDKLVASQKAAFQDFLKSVDFKMPSASQVAAAQQRMDGSTPTELPASQPPIGGSAAPQVPDPRQPVGSAGGAMPLMSAGANPSVGSEGRPKWSVPVGWKEVNGGQFLVAKFVLPGGDAALGAVNVSMSAGEGGGLVGNVNRWRGQLGLGQLPDDEIKKLAKETDVKGGKAWLVDMSGTDARTGTKARLIAAVVPAAGRTWFYKLMGKEDAVEREKEAFTRFVQSAEY